MNAMQATVDWYKENFVAISAIAVQVLILARVIVKYTSSTSDDGIIAKLIEIAKFFGIVIPSEKVDAKMNLTSEIAGSRRDDRPAIRRMIRRVAARNNIALTSDMENQAIAELRSRYSQQATGPFRDFLDWLMENRETILAVLKIVVMLFSAEEKDGAA